MPSFNMMTPACHRMPRGAKSPIAPIPMTPLLRSIPDLRDRDPELARFVIDGAARDPQARGDGVDRSLLLAQHLLDVLALDVVERAGAADNAGARRGLRRGLARHDDAADVELRAVAAQQGALEDVAQLAD